MQRDHWGQGNLQYHVAMPLNREMLTSHIALNRSDRNSYFHWHTDSRIYPNLSCHHFVNYSKSSRGKSFCALRLYRGMVPVIYMNEIRLAKDTPQLENHPCRTVVKSTKCIFSSHNKHGASPPSSVQQQQKHACCACLFIIVFS